MRLLAALSMWLALGAVAGADTFVYVSVAGDRRIAVYQADPTQGQLTHRFDVATDGEPGALAVDPRHRFLFASIRSAGRLASFRIDPRTGTLTPLGTVPAGPDPAYLSTDREGRFLLCAYYVAGQVTVHDIHEDGSLGRQPRQTVKTADKAHAAVLDREDRFAFVPHTAPNAIFQFTFNAKTGELRPAATPVLKTPPGTGPRHLVFHPSKDVAYVSNEQGGSVSAYRLDRAAASLTLLQTLSTLPAGFRGDNACAEVRIDASGRFVYVSNRGHDSIAGFRVSPADGKLEALGQTPTEKTPRSFDLDPAGHYLYAAGESSGKLAAYRVTERGELKRFAVYEVGKQPWWVLALRLPGR